MTQPTIDELRAQLARVEQIRRMFPTCVTCGRSIKGAKVPDLDVIFQDGQPDRLAHLTCPPSAKKLRGVR